MVSVSYVGSSGLMAPVDLEVLPVSWLIFVVWCYWSWFNGFSVSYIGWVGAVGATGFVGTLNCINVWNWSKPNISTFRRSHIKANLRLIFSPTIAPYQLFGLEVVSHSDVFNERLAIFSAFDEYHKQSYFHELDRWTRNWNISTVKVSNTFKCIFINCPSTVTYLEMKN